MILLLLVFFPFICFSIDFRSNNYRAIFNNLNNQIAPTIDPGILNRQIENENNPYSELFGGNLNSAENAFPIVELWKTTQTQTTTFSTFPPYKPQSTTTSKPTSKIETTTPNIPKTTPTIWTTSKSTPLKLSRNPKISSKNNSTSSQAQLSVLSHRLLNDILIIPSSRKLYILAILPIHQSSTNHQSFECGEIDVNSIIRLAAFLESLKEINQSKMLKEIGAEIGAIVVDSCSTDLRSVADLYELLSGTNIQKSDIISIIRDDHSFMPNTEEIMKQLRVPVINTYLSANDLVQTTGVLPNIQSPIRAIIETLKYYQSNCVNLIFDKKFERAAYDFQTMSQDSGICVETFLEMKNETSFEAEKIIRRLLLSEARIVISFLTEDNWIEITKALRTEMVISARFVFLSLVDQRWSTSRKFIENWPTFEQNLISIGPKNDVQENEKEELMKLTKSIPNLTLPNIWLKQFWSSAFQCHLDSFDETTSNHKFSKECEKSQKLNISQIAPYVDISSISIATHSLSIAFRGFVDKNCPGALVISLNDCINDPFDAFYQSILDSNFLHHLSANPVKFNSTTKYRDVPLQISRVQFEDDRLQLSEIGVWNSVQGFSEISTNTKNTSRGSYLLMSSSCQKSKCSQEMAKRTVKQKIPSIFKALTDIEILIFTIFAVLSSLTCLMCMYLKFISNCDYRHCTALCFLGLALLSMSSTAFIIPPNTISCQLRQLLFPISICITIAPVFIKTILLWKFEKTEISATSAILSSIAFIVIQIVISTEWVLLSTSESSTEFVSTIHGTMWRCSNGDSSESTILISCALSAFMSLISVIFSLASLKKSQSLQHLIISIIAILFETSLYVSLPLLKYKTRDLVMATTILIFSFVTLLVSHLNRGKSNDEVGSIQKNENWLQHVQHYHTASTNRQSTIQLDKRQTLQRTNKEPLYGSEAYELPPNATYG
ncbi:unnamed protein product [Caenorhabditis angaria]|uniref:G-protein coupled receptors family 3 profile domain-containing protein n=1 Tax=Caenorhabditis angaria TaxID=860376 RepID=A0A9P1IHZ1_9PELO|nr:unnamed protein product [Caenorhabditis angaria]